VPNKLCDGPEVTPVQGSADDKARAAGCRWGAHSWARRTTATTTPEGRRAIGAAAEATSAVRVEAAAVEAAAHRARGLTPPVGVGARSLGEALAAERQAAGAGHLTTSYGHDKHLPPSHDTTLNPQLVSRLARRIVIHHGAVWCPPPEPTFHGQCPPPGFF
jgi:hypothetical protein